MAHESAWPDVVDALIRLAQATPGFQPPDSAGSGVPVYDTVEVAAYNDIQPSSLVIGWCGEPDDMPVQPGDTTQGLATVGPPHARDEDGEVTCLIVAHFGDIGPGTATEARRAAFDLLDGFGGAVRADPSLGLMGAGGYRNVTAWIDRVQVLTWLNEGPVTKIIFSVRYRARI